MCRSFSFSTQLLIVTVPAVKNAFSDVDVDKKRDKWDIMRKKRIGGSVSVKLHFGGILKTIFFIPSNSFCGSQSIVSKLNDLLCALNNSSNVEFSPVLYFIMNLSSGN